MPNGADIIKDYVTEFSRLQNWTKLRNKNKIAVNKRGAGFVNKHPFMIWNCDSGTI